MGKFYKTFIKVGYKKGKGVYSSPCVININIMKQIENRIRMENRSRTVLLIS